MNPPDPRRAQPAEDERREEQFEELDPGTRWSVKNQARMRVRNDDDPNRSAVDALRFWPETSTAVAVRQTGQAGIEMAAPFGLEDLFNLVVRPTRRFAGAKRDICLERVRTK